MEFRFFEASSVKERFALLLAKLHHVGFLTDYINDTIVASPFFDCFEKNDIAEFMTLSDESVTKAVFHKEVIYDHSLHYLDEYYWAGLNVMNVMMNLGVPLKRILGIMPLKGIVGAYEIYHEMHPGRFLEHYLELENERSLLKTLRNDQGYSIPNIAYLTGIKTSALNLYDRSNAALFGASFANLTKLSILLGISIDAFRKKSTFVPFSLYLMQNKDFETILVDSILGYFNVKEGTKSIVIDHYLNEKEIRKLLGDHKVIVDLSSPFGIIRISSNRICRKYLSEEGFLLAFHSATEKLKAGQGDLIF